MDVDFILGNGSFGNNEDDFDGVFINVFQEDDLVFDLLFEKVIDVNVMFGFYQFGNFVRFVIMVMNEGDIMVQNIVIKDYIVVGLILVDMDWFQ